MKELIILIKQLSKETDTETRNRLHFEIGLLKNQLTSKKLVDDIQKIYNSK